MDFTAALALGPTAQCNPLACDILKTCCFGCFNVILLCYCMLGVVIICSCCSSSNEQKEYLLDVGIFGDLQCILDGFIDNPDVITEVLCVIACLSDICMCKL